VGICDWGGCEVLVYLQLDPRSKSIMTCYVKSGCVNIYDMWWISMSLSKFMLSMCYIFACMGAGGVPDNDPFGKILGCFLPIFGNFIKICNLIMTKGLGFIF